MLMAEDRKRGEKYAALKELIKGQGRVVVAFSGGVDSTALLVVARESGVAVTAVTVDSPFMPRRELQSTRDLAGILGVEHLVINKDDDFSKRILANPPDRCYHCKKEMFGKIITTVERKYGPCPILDGTNGDDREEERPGMKALRELGVLSPLRELAVTKEETRFFLRERGLDMWDKPPSSCLATRIPCGEEITSAKLSMVEAAELYLSMCGFRQIRVRYIQGGAKIEVGREERESFFNLDMMDEVAQKLCKLGFAYVALDLLGYRTMAG